MVKKSTLMLLCTLAIVMALSSLFVGKPSHAEGTATAQPIGQSVKIKTPDGLDIVGLFYPVTAAKAPAVLLLHDGVNNKKQWLRYLPSFTQAGYNVLAVDQRGAGETPIGTLTGELRDAQDKDVVSMVAWLRQQPTVDAGAVALIGARLGANFAIRACANDDQCHTVIALTPSTDFFGVKTEDAVKSMTKNKALFIVESEFGENGAKSLKQLQLDVSPHINVMTRNYGFETSSGTDLFDKDPNLMPMVLLWLKTYNHS